MLNAITSWLAALWKATFGALWDFVQDAAIAVADAAASAVVSVIGAVPVPEFASAGMGAMLSGLPAPVMYLVAKAGLASALALYGAGWAFRLVRKAVTLFQW